MIESIHYVRSLYNDNIYFAILGDYNRTDVRDILDSYGPLQNIQVEKTRGDEILDLITDLHIFYLPSLTLPPLDVDADKKGVASDHRIIVFPRLQSSKNKVGREKKVIKDPFVIKISWNVASFSQFIHGRKYIMELVLMKKWRHFIPFC